MVYSASGNPPLVFPSSRQKPHPAHEELHSGLAAISGDTEHAPPPTEDRPYPSLDSPLSYSGTKRASGLLRGFTRIII